MNFRRIGVDQSRRFRRAVPLRLRMEERVRPVEVNFFDGGRLRPSTLNLLHRTFMEIVALATTRERIGGLVNPEVAREWTRKSAPRVEAPTGSGEAGSRD